MPVSAAIVLKYNLLNVEILSDVCSSTTGDMPLLLNSESRMTMKTAETISERRIVRRILYVAIV